MMSIPQFHNQEQFEAWRSKVWHRQTLAYAAGRDSTARSLGNKVRRVSDAMIAQREKEGEK